MKENDLINEKEFIIEDNILKFRNFEIPVDDIEKLKFKHYNFIHFFLKISFIFISLFYLYLSIIFGIFMFSIFFLIYRNNYWNNEIIVINNKKSFLFKNNAFIGSDNKDNIPVLIKAVECFNKDRNFNNLKK